MSEPEAIACCIAALNAMLTGTPMKSEVQRAAIVKEVALLRLRLVQLSGSDPS